MKATAKQELLMFKKSLKMLEELTKVQCYDGNWNYDSYMHGMANGMILALSLFKDKRPEYLEAPTQWGMDAPPPEKPVTVTSED